MKDKLIIKCQCGRELRDNGKIGKDAPVFCPICYNEALCRIIELKACLIDMLDQFGGNYSLSAVEDACALLNHPKSSEMPDACYCRNIVYNKKEARRRKKLNLNFGDRTNVKL